MRLYDFAAREEWILDLNRYTDYSHHDPEMNEQVVRAMAEDEGRVTSTEKIAQANEALREAVAAFERPY